MAAAYPATRERPSAPQKTGSWCPAQLKALAMWPRLERRGLVRAGCSPARIANYVSHRTQMPVTAIEKILTAAEESGE